MVGRMVLIVYDEMIIAVGKSFCRYAFVCELKYGFQSDVLVCILNLDLFVEESLCKYE
jgi:hypothetical protein